MATNIWKLSDQLIEKSCSLDDLKTLYNNDLVSSKDLEELLDNWTCMEVLLHELPQGEHIDQILDWLLENFDHDMYD